MKKILIIEDDDFLGGVLQGKFKSKGYNALLIKDGQQGLDMIKSEKPELVLLDMMLPNLSGYEILERKYKDPEIKDIPVLVISNSGQEIEIKRIKSFGATDYMIKVEFTPEEVLEKVEKILMPENSKTETIKPAADSSKPLTGVKILWVEDDVFLSELLARKLSHEGAELMHAANGEEALEILKTKVPDVITLDIVLPGISGLKTLEELRKVPKLLEVPVIMLSNLSQKEDIDRAVRLGAKKFLVKASVTLDEIITEICGVIKK